MKEETLKAKIQKSLQGKPKLMIGTGEYNAPLLREMNDMDVDKLLHDTGHKMSDDKKIIPTIINMQEIEIIDSTDTD